MLLTASAAAAVAIAAGVRVPTAFAYLSIAITLVAYTLYITQMFPGSARRPVKPQPLSWVLFGFLTATGAAVQVMQGAGLASWCLLLTSVACFLIAGISFVRWRDEWHFDLFHAAVTVAALLLFAFSLVTSRDARIATASALSATLADLVSYGPTFKKARVKPEDDSAGNFALNSLKTVPALYALPVYTVATSAYLVMLLVVNAAFALFLFVRQRDLGASGTP